MTQITYIIVRQNGAWRIACNGLVGAPYARMQDAVKDVMFIAELLERAGEKVELLVDHSGSGLADARCSDVEHHFFDPR